MKKPEIIAAINRKVDGTNYDIWIIGLTHDLAESKKFWAGAGIVPITHWKDWQAESLTDAQEIETYFVGKGTKSGTGRNLSSRRPVYVYIF